MKFVCQNCAVYTSQDFCTNESRGRLVELGNNNVYAQKITSNLNAFVFNLRTNVN